MYNLNYLDSFVGNWVNEILPSTQLSLHSMVSSLKENKRRVLLKKVVEVLSDDKQR